MKQSNVLKDGVLYAAIYLMILMATVFIPGIEIVTLFILPLPFVLFASRYGWKAALAFSAGAIFISLFVATIYSLPLTAIAVFGGVAVGLAIHQRKNPYEAWAQGAVGFVIGIVMFYLLSLWLFNINWIEEIDGYIQESIQTSKQIMESVGSSVSEEQLQLLEEQFSQVTVLLPSFMGIFAVGLAFITLWLGFKMMNKLFNESFYFPPIRSLSFPKVLLWYYLIAVIATWFDFEQGTIWKEAVQNAYTFTGFFITLQGLSFMFAYAYEKKLSKAFPITGVVITLLLPFLLLYPVRILGIIDLGFSLRERLSNKKD
ncbi:YybS family protein [Pontibacillus yanchengensis]|uniref:DUF2232 domain-containing protein n=1 Tax=Pontibacillus yanchengensis Y32 TaxID=1385514 RepID=A0A0A2TV91_9BACI|nr:YybS family protein [Pontibacillus yanchengensis]KGP73205.1 hypothetical protein N782_06840 [Pontibacillus yanchengensis Y32]